MHSIFIPDRSNKKNPRESVSEFWVFMERLKLWNKISVEQNKYRSVVKLLPVASPTSIQSTVECNFVAFIRYIHIMITWKNFSQSSGLWTLDNIMNYDVLRCDGNILFNCALCSVHCEFHSKWKITAKMATTKTKKKVGDERWAMSAE